MDRHRRFPGHRVGTLALLAAAALLALGPAAARAQDEVVVANSGSAPPSIVTFSILADGNVAPLRVLTDATGQLNSPTGVAVDLANDEMFVVTAGDPWSVRVYRRSASGSHAPLRVITGPSTGLNDPFDVAYDPVHQEIFVANLLGDSSGPPFFAEGSVTVYNRTDTGDVAPKRKIAGAFTNMKGPWSLALDLVNDELVIANNDAGLVTVHARTANGNAVAKRNIGGGNTQIDDPQGVAVDTVHGVIAVANKEGSGSYVTLFDRSTALNPFSNPPPLQVIADGFTNVIGVAFDPLNGDLYVTDSDFFAPAPVPATANRVRVYQRGAGASYALARTIAGAATLLRTPMHLTVTRTALPGTTLVAAVLPLSRSVRVGVTATAFVTIINSGAATAFGVGIAPAQGIPATFTYQQTDCATNALTSTPGTPADIAPGGTACYAIFITPTAAFGPIDLGFNFAGANTAPVARLVGVNTLLISGSATDVPDVIALVATPSNDGIVRIPTGGSAAFSVATSNVGAGDTITVGVDTGGVSLPLTVLVCRTDLAVDPTGGCVGPVGPTISLSIGPGATHTFAIFVTATGSIAFDPALHRMFVRFTGSDGVVRGMTGVAVMTQ